MFQKKISKIRKEYDFKINIFLNNKNILMNKKNELEY